MLIILQSQIFRWNLLRRFGSISPPSSVLWCHMTSEVTWQKLKHNGGDLDSLIAVECRSSLMYFHGFPDLPRDEPFVLGNDLGVIDHASMSRFSLMFCDGRGWMFAISVLFEPCTQCSPCFADVLLITLSTLRSHVTSQHWWRWRDATETSK